MYMSRMYEEKRMLLKICLITALFIESEVNGLIKEFDIKIKIVNELNSCGLIQNDNKRI